MVFKMVTLDLTQDLEDDFGGPPESLPSSPSSTNCCTATFAIAASTALGLARTFRRRERANNRIEYGDATELVVVEPGNLTVFIFQELQVATNNFSKENLIGQGGYGEVYKGTLANGYVVAVKRTYREIRNGLLLEFQAEVKVGNMSNHRNVAPLLGFCACPKPREFLLVYPYMVNRSVAYCFENKKPPESLKWQTRMEIALGVARGIAHLHSLNIIHRDIKSSNVLLDERFHPLIGDFGIAVFLDEHHKPKHDAPSDVSEMEASDPDTTCIAGTFGYMAPEYVVYGHCSKKIDVFGFGVTLLELVSGKRARYFHLYFNCVKRLLKEGRCENLIEEGDYEESEVERLVMTALLCLQEDPRERPSMLQVVQFLQGNGVQERWQDKMDEIKLAFTEDHDRVHTDDSVSDLIPEQLSGLR